MLTSVTEVAELKMKIDFHFIWIKAGRLFPGLKIYSCHGWSTLI